MPGALDPRSPAQVEKYLTGALKVIRRKALYSASVDWDAVRAEAAENAARAKNHAGTHRLLSRVLKQAGGVHSHMVLSYRLPGATERAPARTETAPADGEAAPPLPEGRLVEGAAYLTLPRWSGRSLSARRYIAAGTRLVDGLAADGPAGWIVDLRENTGGGMWPMLAAAAGLLDRGPLGGFLLPDGRRQTWWLRRRYVSLGHRPMARVHRRAHHGNGAPLAILVSARTASAGEAALVALRSQPLTRTFGSPTAGMTTGNVTHRLPDGTRLMISTCHYVDAFGRRVTGSIEPDEPTAQGDEALEHALAWIARGREDDRGSW